MFCTDNSTLTLSLDLLVITQTLLILRFYSDVY